MYKSRICSVHFPIFFNTCSKLIYFLFIIMYIFCTGFVLKQFWRTTCALLRDFFVIFLRLLLAFTTIQCNYLAQLGDFFGARQIHRSLTGTRTRVEKASLAFPSCSDHHIERRRGHATCGATWQKRLQALSVDLAVQTRLIRIERKHCQFFTWLNC